MDRSRFYRLVPEEVGRQHVVLVGCGGLNSYVGACLARLGVGQFTLVDDDMVEEANVSTQDYGMAAVNEFKVDALAERLLAINPEVMVRRKMGRVPEVRYPEDATIIIVGPDSVEARQAAWRLYEEQFGGAPVLPLYIDHRMGAVDYEIHVVKGEGYNEEYERVLLADDPASYAEEACGATAIAFTGMHAGARVGSVVASWLRNEQPEGWMAEHLGSQEVGLKRYWR